MRKTLSGTLLVKQEDKEGKLVAALEQMTCETAVVSEAIEDGGCSMFRRASSNWLL